MVLNTSTLELDNLQGQEYRRHINNLLRKAVLRRVNNARRRLPVVASIIADEQMVARTDLLNDRCYSIVSLVKNGIVDDRMRYLPFDCAVVILLGVFACTVPIYWFRERM